ncbi:polysaccharide deacetylase family protein [Arthrobacter sp. B2a2-09]|uniref:polysaccharide deacetylase family protein n=1 Tax=Arthrobacter sp. B2a2-09 TaxID=2952822 RepID=UPI0022CDA2B5|nr:polysaccharide deacetylase family protein [Arthrobacter sp. B2a2-09]MCZ9882199.1 polysaccharide deacetylase family protein [Arthrobacter sp. B2a2-09]
MSVSNPSTQEKPKPRIIPTAGARRRRSRAIAAIAAIAMAGVALVVAAPAAQAANPTVVSLTFDDGNADQLNAAQIMKAQGMVGTFFITSGFTDNPGYMSQADLHGLVADGNEIGGHTVTHPDLITLPADEAKRQICNDRVNLSNWGFSVTDFAYPFASENAAAETIAQSCGYNSARGLGDIKTRFSCPTCSLAETMPPADPYNTAAPDEVDSTWTLADLQTSVTQAEAAGGWVQLTFHHIDANSTDPLNIQPALFEQFLTWLKARPATTTVKTVNQVIGGTVQPLVSGPAVPPQAPSGNLVQNPGLETLTSGMPQCWFAGGYGTNTPSFSLVSPGRTGAVAEKLVMTGYVDGDAKLLPALDLGGCSPTATEGHQYNIGAWYTSTVPTQFTLYYRTGLGSWKYWTSSPWFAPATSYQKAAWTTPALPAGANGISFGLNLFSNGTLITDDYEMFDTATAPAPAPPAPGTNLVQNAGLETAGIGSTPQCWQAGGYGTNTPAFSTVPSAHSGTAAEQLVVSGYIDGDAKLLQTMDSGSCAPAAIAGHSYSLRAWYTSTAVTQFTVYYRDASGAWVYWTSSPWLAASDAYTQASFTTPVLPDGATAVSFGLNLFSNGTLTTDDYAMYDTVGAPPL